MSRSTVGACGACVVTVALVLAATGFLIAGTDMIVRIQPTLRASDGGVESLEGKSYLALPYKPKEGLVTASDLMDDIGFDYVESIERFLPANDSFEAYTGRAGSAPDFSLEAGVGYVVTMSAHVTYDVVGLHDSSAVIVLRAADGGDLSESGRNLFAPPYNLIPETAHELMEDIGFDLVESVSRYNAATGELEEYTGRAGSPVENFELSEGEAVFVTVSQTVEYTPTTH